LEYQHFFRELKNEFDLQTVNGSSASSKVEDIDPLDSFRYEGRFTEFRVDVYDYSKTLTDRIWKPFVDEDFLVRMYEEERSGSLNLSVEGSGLEDVLGYIEQQEETDRVYVLSENQEL